MIEDLKAHGTDIIYISHKLDEILRISDHISVQDRRLHGAYLRHDLHGHVRRR